MYTVEGKTYKNLRELTKEYNRREFMKGMELTKEFVKAYREASKIDKDKKNAISRK